MLIFGRGTEVQVLGFAIEYGFSLFLGVEYESLRMFLDSKMIEIIIERQKSFSLSIKSVATVYLLYFNSRSSKCRPITERLSCSNE